MARQAKHSVKFMMVLERFVYKQLQVRAHKRGVTVQELLRVEVAPRYLGLDILKRRPVHVMKKKPTRRKK